MINFIVGGVVLVIILAALHNLHKNNKKGGCGCGCGGSCDCGSKDCK